MGRLPEGRVTFLFSDIAGSTLLLQELGHGYADVLLDHQARLREVFARHRGVEVSTAGDSFFVAFQDAVDAADAALAAQAVLLDTRVRVRIGVHTGEPILAGDDYVGIDVHRAARISGVVHGGQVVVSDATRRLLPPDAHLADLGSHRLKDLVAHEHLFQLGPGEFPPLRSLSATNLPEQASALIGRVREIAEVVKLLTDRRVVTLIGPGGIGNTRLAIQAAAEQAEHYPDGVFWVPLAAFEDPDLVLRAIAEALGTDRPVADHIDERRLLIVLDNLEQVLDAAPHISGLVERCPNLRLLITSRSPLRIKGEHEYAVPPLPDGDALTLFRERAFDVESPAVVLEICRRVDCLPLAVELAAARTRMFTPGQLLARLDPRLPLLTGGRRDAPIRHRALRDTIEWSYNLLDPESQETFARLGAFAGSFEVESAEAVVDATVDRLQLLTEASLLRKEGSRLSMLETIREYAVERLEASTAAAAIRDRHLRHFLDLAEHGQVEIRGARVEEWMSRFRREEDNLRAAIGWAVESRAAAEALRLCTAMTPYWQAATHIAEGVRWFDQALAVSDGVAAAIRASALGSSGWLLNYDDRPGAGLERLEEAVALWRTLGEGSGLAEAMVGMCAALCLVDRARARPALQEALKVSDRTGYVRGEARVLHLLGEVLRDDGDFEEGERSLKRCIELSTRHEWQEMTGSTIHSLADLELDRGDLGRAAALYRSCLRSAGTATVDRHVAYCIAGLSAVAAGQGDTGRAALLWATLLHAESAMSFRIIGRERARYERHVAHLPPFDGHPLDLHEAARLVLADEGEVADA